MTHRILIFICIILLLNSCKKDESEDGYKKALNFHKKYATEFLESELNKFRYHPRTQYDLVDSNSFRVLVREDRNLRIISPYGFAEMFKLPLDSNLLNGQATFEYMNSEYVFEIDNYETSDYLISGNNIKKTIETNISYTFPKETIGNNPIAYFNKLEKLRNKYGIVNY